NEVLCAQNLHELCPCESRSSEVKCPAKILLNYRPRESGEVAYVDELHVVRTVPRRQHFAVPQGMFHPLRIATTWIMGSDDNLWTQECASVGVDLLDNVFASDFEAAVHLPFHLGHVL